mmetsp:Transcript_24877/g.53664  ORF Transcript_24877/g.53664 Transcript_24877/m.53664 type:complete len:789 (-) Transcript_24877:315-2681(-)|eukprot:CAMPEP_0172315744 /NCGR_PEP_ID=MMETSP1058-20130122/26151_1 /TAXON_ID=83371 /ORGANISM="Detonula confervacea, Strain CCMP 353" /LENGTH=788 /DNA_ID=CAMNT_0013029897 /DNA_START=46 /DNA_END=2412 /DNA_ORIENTATION=-
MASPQVPPKVQKTTFTFKSDIRKSQFDAQPCCGVLHAFRCSSPSSSSSSGAGREEHSFAWIANYDTVETALCHLERYGFTRDAVQFVPFSSKTNWITKYPHAFPYVDCDEGGTVTGFPYWSPHAQSALDIPPEVVHVAAQPSTAAAIGRSATATVIGREPAKVGVPSKKKGGGIGNRLTNTLLTNSERNQLHNEIYNYFSWLNNQVAELETSESGRRQVKKADLHASSLKGLLFKLESTFKVVGQLQQKKKPSADNSEGKGTSDTSSSDPADETSEAVTRPFPFMEVSLLNDMSNLAAAEEDTQKKLRAKIKIEASQRRKSAHWEPLDFDTMFDKVLAYKEEHGHPNVPVKYQQDIQLGSWVSGLRTKKKAYDKDGGDASMMDLDEEAGWSLDNEKADATSTSNNSNTNTPPTIPAAPQQSQKYLNPERIQRLESVGFSWSMAKPKTKPKSWDERLDELKQWHEDHDTYKVPRATSLGEWLHNQRTLYGKRDTKFMTKKAPRMEAIGYSFDLRENTAVSWDDRFQHLVEYHQKHGNFEVPCPVSEEVDTNGDVGNSEETEEKYKFFKWVSRLHNEHRAYEKGTSSKLNEERVQKLKSVNFQFKGPKSRGRPSTGNINPVPSLPWEKRIQQVESFRQDTGHLNIDHNYKHCSNLGGWAADMSTLYKDWKAGSQQLSEDMIAKFNQLIALGFNFNVLSFYENNRSWEDHYAVLLKFKEGNNGSARVPLKYKADLRLGKWVQSQRQQYKLLREGKKSKLTEERIEKLESAGFEWALAPGSTKEEEEEEDQE